MLGGHIAQWVAGLSDYASRFLDESTAEDVEGIFVDCLRDIATHSGHRVKARGNLWHFVDKELLRQGPSAVLGAYRHPLQPDVDLLVEYRDHEQALCIHEIKVIRWDEKRLQTQAPAGRLYAGLAQALMLTTFGADYCYLWHVFVYPRVAYRIIAERDTSRAERIDNGRAEFFAAYPAFVKAIMGNFALPLGYVVLMLIADFQTREFEVAPVPNLWREPARLSQTDTGARVRELMMRALDTRSARGA
jgi:hypothetical protein